MLYISCHSMRGFLSGHRSTNSHSLPFLHPDVLLICVIIMQYFSSYLTVYWESVPTSTWAPWRIPVPGGALVAHPGDSVTPTCPVQSWKGVGPCIWTSRGRLLRELQGGHFKGQGVWEVLQQQEEDRAWRHPKKMHPSVVQRRHLERKKHK